MSDIATSSTDSIWLSGPTSLANEGPLQEDLVTDVCVVGAGIAGLTTAYLLGKAGKKVVVLEAGEGTSGETSRTTAHLASALDDRFYKLERAHGKDGARLAAQSHSAAIDRIEAIARDEGIDCDFARVDGYLFEPPGGEGKELEKEHDAAHRAGLVVERVARAPFSTFDTGPCLRFSHQGQFHPLKYLTGLAGAIRRQGGRTFFHSPVKLFEGGAGARAVTRAGATVRAQALVVATNTPVNDLVTMHTKQFPYRTYVLALRLPGGDVPRALYWDTLDPYHYVRLQRQSATEDHLIVGGEDHKTGQARDEGERFARLESWARERFPHAKDVEARWSGQVLEPMDGLAFIGRNPGDEPNVYVVTGDSGHGMTHGTIAGMLLTDLIGGRDNPWAKLYDPSRRLLWAAGEFVSENVNVAAQYLDWVKPGDVRDVGEIAPGEGAVLRVGLRMVAVSKDELGQPRRLSAVCPHLGCIVHWNNAEKTWDCPCHGSRFDVRGQVLNGPATAALSPVAE